MKFLRNLIIWIVVIGLVIGGIYLFDYFQEMNVLKKVISRLEADSRVAQVVVTNVSEDPKTGEELTTIKFLEYDAEGKPLKPKYFTFSGNVIQFQALVIRFSDIHIRDANLLKGKSAYLFWKVFMLDGKQTQEYVITPVRQIPKGYKVKGLNNIFEKRLWERFWRYALNNRESKEIGIKNAQIEAPGTKFIPGRVYTIKIEHDGGLRIDSESIPEILKGEEIPFDSSIK